MQLGHFALVLSAILVAGCGGENLNRPPVYKVSGKVTLQGSPVAGADITFVNKEANRSSFGRTNQAGEYQLSTFGANDGALEGKHDVAIMKIAPIAPTAALPDVESQEYQPPGVGESTLPEAPKSEIPEQYGNAATSGLLGIVNKDGENKIDFDLQ